MYSAEVSLFFSVILEDIDAFVTCFLHEYKYLVVV
jgi:hypothetical protein